MKYYFAIFFLIALASCGSNTPEVDNEFEGGKPSEPVVSSFTLNGQVTGAHDKNFYIETFTDRGRIEVAQAKSDATGKFTITGTIPGFGEYYLRMGETNDNIIPMVIVPNDKISVVAEEDQFSNSATISGTSWSALMTEFLPLYSSYLTKMNGMKKNAGSMSELEQIEFYVSSKQDIEKFSIAKMKTDPTNPYNLILFKNIVPMYDSQIAWDQKNNDVLYEVATAFKKTFPNSPITRAMELQVNTLISTAKGANGASTAPEITLANPDGKIMSLSDLRGQYVLIDFWASWCAPCRAESPNVVKMYNKYKDKGFTVFSVSLDEDASKWKQAIAKDGLNWPYHVSDLKMWQSPIPPLYGIQGIPHTVLIDKEGKIIGTGLRGVTLEWKLKEVFSNK